RDIPMHEKAADVVMTSAYGVTGRWREAYEAQDRARAHSLLNDWGASSFAERPFASLSEGERKRVLIARALMSDPELLLLDEPGAGLDLAGREELVGMLATFAHKPDSPTLVLVTHHLEEIPPGITHALLLGQGQMVAAGPLDQTLTNQLLSRTFGMNFDVRRIGERWSAVTSQS
nr:ATP-binding cassette domain-containing protein [Actinomycetes bacterium]